MIFFCHELRPELCPLYNAHEGLGPVDQALGVATSFYIDISSGLKNVCGNFFI